MTYIGTSGYSYPEWKGSFYPATLAAAKMLPYYAERFPRVEVNYTFNRLPSEKMVANWVASTPETFRFSLKAPKQITHISRLRGCEAAVAAFYQSAAPLEQRLGMLLFQLPPFLKKDLALLAEFLPAVPAGARAAFEFRHPSWHDEEVFSCLRARNLTLCVASSEKLVTPRVATGDFGYFRLRDADYTDDQLAGWAEELLTPGFQECFVYFKHEDTGRGPELARKLGEAIERRQRKGPARPRPSGIQSSP